MLAFWNGSFLPEDDVRISISDRGFLYGDGVFTTLKVSNGHIECLEAHLHRLYEQCLFLKIKPPNISLEWLTELVRCNKAFDSDWRLKIIATGGSLGKEESLRSCSHLIMTLSTYTPSSKSTFELTIYPTPIHKPTAKIKSLAYLDRLYIKEYAENHGYDDVVVISSDGHILETAFANIFWMEGEQLFFPDLSQPLLSGIALDVVIQSACRLGISVSPVRIKTGELPAEARIFVCNAMMGMIPVSRIEAIRYNIEKNSVLQRTYCDLVRQNSLSCQ